MTAIRKAKRSAKPRRTPKQPARTTKKKPTATRPRRKKTQPARAKGHAPPVTPTAFLDAKEQPDVVDVPARVVLALEGQGIPQGATGPFQDAIGALYGLVFTLKFTRKAAGRGDFRVGAIEARWRSDRPDTPITHVPPAEWRWRLRLDVPADVTAAEIADAARALTAPKKKLAGSPLPGRAGIERLPAARYGRVLHVGPYDQEGATFERLLAHVRAAGVVPRYAHSEVYLNDPRRVSPARTKTALLLELPPA